MESYFHRGRSGKRSKKQDEVSNSGNVLTRWLKDLRDLRPTRDPKVTLPLGRTQSASGRDRRAKVTRTLSAGHRPRRDVIDANKYQTYNERFVREQTNAPRRRGPSISSDEQAQILFTPKQEHVYENAVVAASVNRHAKVSYLDEEGLRKRDDEKDFRRWSEVMERPSTPVQDDCIMPASSALKASQPVTHHQALNEKINQTKPIEKNEYTRIEYLKYKQEETNNTYRDSSQHEYENLPVENNPKRWEDDVDNVPARDSASLKSIRYGPGHEKYPSWPGSTPGPADKPHRSLSWTQQTNYPKERPAGYAKLTPKRPNPTFTQQLKTVVERCEKMADNRRYLPRMDRDGNTIGDQDYMVPSPPERDVPSFTQNDIEKYCQSSPFSKTTNGDYASVYEDLSQHPHHLTQADLEEYSRNDDPMKVMHQHQSSYAQSEGYHSYVSSSELTTTPFLDRLRQDRESQNQRWEEENLQDRRTVWDDNRTTQDRSQRWDDLRLEQDRRNQQWDEDIRPGRDSVVTTSSGSGSSSETLKCHGSMSDVSVASSSCRSKQQIAHSSRVAQPQRHHSESVLYLGKGDRTQQLKLFAVNTYTMQPLDSGKQVISPTSQPQFSVAERISELERQQQKLTYLDPERRCRVPDPTLKAIQKKALLSFYERHQQSSGAGLSQAKAKDSWKSEPQLVQRDVKDVPPRVGVPQPPPRPLHSPGEMNTSWGKHSSSMNSLHHAVIVGSPISIDDWVPERPPKKPQLRPLPIPSRVEVPAVPERVPSPDLPPPPPPEVIESDVPFPDEPLPPPPEAEWLLATAVPRISTPGPASPLSDPPLSQVQGTFGSPTEQSMVLGMIVQPEEIQYDPDAINAIMECNRGAKDLQRRRPRKPRDEPPASPRSHIENRPPLPLPRDAQPPGPKTGCDLDDLTWLAQYGKARKQKKTLSQALDSAPANPFIRSNKEATVRASIKMLKNEMASRMSLRSPKDKPRTDSDNRHMQRNIPASESIAAMQRSVSVNDTSAALRSAQPSIVRSISVNNREIISSNQNDAKSTEWDVQEPELATLTRAKVSLPSETERLRSQTMKKFSELDSRSSGASFAVFDRRMTEEIAVEDPPPGYPQLRSNSKAAYLAVRREKELGINNYEGSYKLTMSPSGETLEPRNEKLKNGKSLENLVLDNRLPLEPPDVIPKMNRVAEPALNQECPRNNYEKYRLLPTSFNPRIGSNRLGFTEISEEEGVKPVLNDQPEIVVEKPAVEAKTSEPLKSEDMRSPVVDERRELSPPDVTRTRRLVERSTSFGRGDTMKLIDLEVEADVDGETDAGISLSDAASQTELADDDDGEDDEDVDDVPDVNQVDDLEVERLSRDLASQLSPSDKLLSLLVPAAERKRPTDYVAGLFRLDATSRRRHPRKHKTGSSCSNVSSTSSSSSVSTTSSGSSSSDSSAQQDLNKPEPVVPLPSSSPYYTTSESKARLLNRYPEGIDHLPLRDSAELKQKKEELTQRLDKKLEILRSEQLALTDEAGLNEELGTAVAVLVARVARPHEATKYRLHVEEVGKITSLLLGLSGRLARAENALFGLPGNHSERKIHEEKRDKLREQLVEAKILKESIDRRSEQVCKILSKYLSEEDLADYLHFIHMKEKLIVDAREVADKIALGEEQLAALSEHNTVWP